MMRIRLRKLRIFLSSRWFYFPHPIILLIGIGAFIYVLDTSAQQPKIIQTDYKDIGSRQKADRDIWAELRRINRQTQVDTVYLTEGQTADTVYLEQKYADTDYKIFANIKVVRGIIQSNYYLLPLTDSSFQITKATDDSSTVQWMTISK